VLRAEASQPNKENKLGQSGPSLAAMAKIYDCQDLPIKYSIDQDRPRANTADRYIPLGMMRLQVSDVTANELPF
jgi:hypothetical protein